jgi:hypothetical protein
MGRRPNVSIVVNLPEELENELSAEAARAGLSLPEYASRILASGRTMAPHPKTGRQLVDFWRDEELIGSRPDIVSDSQTHARDLRRRAERRERA